MPQVSSRVFPRAPAATGVRSFTLLELVIVLAIIAMVGAMAVPRYVQAVARSRLDAAANRLVADLTMGRNRAIAQSRTLKIGFDVATERYNFTGMADPVHPDSSYTVSLGAEPYRADIESADCGGDATLIFNGFGYPDSAATIALAVGNEKRTVVVDGTTGGVSAP